MNAFRIKPLLLPWPPLVFGLLLIAAFLMDRYVPTGIDFAATRTTAALGMVMIAGGVALDLWALKTLFDSKTTVLPHRCPSHLVTRGPFRFSRNPIYVGYTVSSLGLGLLFANPWAFVAAGLALGITAQLIVRREEWHLLSRFGIEYETYCQRTRRWI
jgi:protein-S-isoprenylcysteine O-methyltransferase Ste14